jgi:hypothetical protein
MPCLQFTGWEIKIPVTGVTNWSDDWLDFWMTVLDFIWFSAKDLSLAEKHIRARGTLDRRAIIFMDRNYADQNLFAANYTNFREFLK